MGTVVSYVVHPGGLTEADARQALAESVAELHRLDGIFSTWDESSPMSRFRSGQLDRAALPVDIDEVLALSRSARRITLGWFDPWALPGGVDPTGLVKGWAIERAAALVASAGVEGVLVAGGGDVASYGSDAGRLHWRVGVRHPWRAGSLACVVRLAGGSAVATSGRYERGEHLIDPFATRGLPPVGARVVSASVTGPSLALADAVATALVIAGGRAAAVAERLEAGYEAYWITEKGDEELTAGFPLAGIEPSHAEAPLPAGEVAQGPEEVDPPEGWPVGVDEHALGIGRLPHEEAGEARLAARADQQVGVGQVGAVAVLGHALGIDAVGELLGGHAAGEQLHDE